ncbi:MAG: hypothetical protein ABSB32_09160 [Thermodesulfobacteriota bacterium]
MKKIFYLAAIVFAFGLSSAAWAEYVIKLKNGRILPVSIFWEEKGVVKFYWQSGIVGIPKKDILSIKAGKAERRERIPNTSEPGPNSGQIADAAVSAEAQESAQDKKTPDPGALKEKVGAELYEKQKAYYKAEYEKALERYFEAASRHDAEAKKKAWEEFNRFGGEVISLEEELKKSTQSTTPEQRAQ